MRTTRLVSLAISFLAVVVAAAAQTAPKLADYYTVIAPKVIDSDYSPFFIDIPPYTADLNGDGNEDLIVLGIDFLCCGDPPDVPQPGRVFFGDGNGNFAAPAPGQFPRDTFKVVNPQKAVFGDLNGDGRLDMFIAGDGTEIDPFPGEQNRLYLSEPGGIWVDATSRLPQINDFTQSAALGDLSGRGVLDIIVGNSLAGKDQVDSYALLNDGAGNFTMTRANIPAGQDQVMDSRSGHWFYGTALADLDGDGLPELILAAGNTSGPYNKAKNTTILWNHGGVFDDGDRTELPAPSAFPIGVQLHHARRGAMEPQAAPHGTSGHEAVSVPPGASCSRPRRA